MVIWIKRPFAKATDNANTEEMIDLCVNKILNMQMFIEEVPKSLRNTVKMKLKEAQNGKT